MILLSLELHFTRMRDTLRAILSCSGVSPWRGWVYSVRRFLQVNRDVDLGLTPCLRRERKIYFCLSTELEVLDSDCFMVSLEVTLVREKMKRRTASVGRGRLDLQIQIASLQRCER